MEKYKQNELLIDMGVNMLTFMHQSVNDKTMKYLNIDHGYNELDKMNMLLSKHINLPDSILDESMQITLQCFNLLLDRKDSIVYLYYNSTKNFVNSQLIKYFRNKNKNIIDYETELKILLNDESVDIVPELNDINDIKFSHMQLSRMLCYGSVVTCRNMSFWKNMFAENRTDMQNAFINHTLTVLKMLKRRQNFMSSSSVEIEYNYADQVVAINDENRNMKSNMITVDTNQKADNKNSDLEICYLSGHWMLPRSPGEQQTIKFAQFVELNALPYCLFNATLPNNMSINVYNLHKTVMEEMYQENISDKPSRLGNVLLINKLKSDSVTQSDIINYINCYYVASDRRKTRQNFRLRLVGEFAAYKHNYRLAALDFIILMLVASVTQRRLRYTVSDAYEKMFQEIKTKTCKMSVKKVINMLANYNVNVEPMQNFKANYQII